MTYYDWVRTPLTRYESNFLTSVCIYAFTSCITTALYKSSSYTISQIKDTTTTLCSIIFAVGIKIDLEMQNILHCSSKLNKNASNKWMVQSRQNKITEGRNNIF